MPCSTLASRAIRGLESKASKLFLLTLNTRGRDHLTQELLQHVCMLL